MTGPTNSGRAGELIERGQDRQTGLAAVNVQRFAHGNNVVRVSGDLTGHAAPTLHRTLTEEITRSPTQLAVDLRGMGGIDNAGVDALVSAAGLAAGSAITFALVATSTGPVAAALAAADVRHLFEVFASVQDAWELKRSGS
jgi:anti-anti-sigma factor